MSILIKGIELPTTYPLTVTIYPDGKVLSETVGAKDKHGTAVPVPPHGRLIAEGDAIETAWMILAGLGYRRKDNQQLEQTVREVFATAPAIEVE